MALASKPYRYLLGILILLFALALSSYREDAGPSVEATQEVLESLAPSRRSPARAPSAKKAQEKATKHAVPAPVTRSFDSESPRELSDEERTARYIAEEKRRWPTQQFLWNLWPLSWEEAKAKNKLPKVLDNPFPDVKPRVVIVTDVFQVEGCPARFGMLFSNGERSYQRKICASPCLAEKIEGKNVYTYMTGTDFSEFGRVHGFLRVAVSSESMNKEDNPLFKYVLSFEEAELFENQAGMAATFRYFEKEDKFMGYGPRVAYWPLWQETKNRPLDFPCDWDEFRD